MADVEPFEKRVRRRRGYETARLELLRLEELLAPHCSAEGKPYGSFQSFIETATSLDTGNTTMHMQMLSSELAGIDQDEMLLIWQRWMLTDSVFLHILVPHVLAAYPVAREDSSLYVLDAGFAYPEPSFKRYFIQATVRQLGLCRVLGILLERAQTHDRDSLRAVAASYYWAYYDPDTLSGGVPSDHSATTERELRSALKRRLRRVADYLRPWWKFW